MSIIWPISIIATLSVLVAQLDAVSNLGFSALSLAIVLGILAGHIPSISFRIKRSKVHSGEVEQASKTGIREPDIVQKDLCNQTNINKSQQRQSVIDFCRQRLLKLGIVLFGFSMSFQQVAHLGWQVLVIDFIVMISIFSIGFVIGTRYLNLSSEQSMLISVGSAVCGAAAVLATEPVVKPKQQEVIIAIATVVVFGTISMFCYPVLLTAFDLNIDIFGVYIGSTVHEVAQVLAAGERINTQVLNDALVVKLIRVMMLAPFVIILAFFLTQARATNHTCSVTDRWQMLKHIHLPWFVFGFILTAGLNSMIVLPALFIESMKWVSQFSLAMAMTALGYQTQIKLVKQAGLKPLVLGFILFVILIVGGYALNYMILG
jgi:uncharacterized integral membrane protein (TIGR00698 family)